MKAPFPWFGGKSRVAHLVWKQGLFSELMGLAMRDADEAAEKYLVENVTD